MYVLLVTFILIFIIKLLYHSNKINQIYRAGGKGDFHNFVVSGKYKRNLEKERQLRKKLKRRVR